MSGEAQATAQAHTVYGGIHMYPQESAGRLPRRVPLWQVSGCVALIVVAGLTAVVVLTRRQSDSPQGGPIPSAKESNAVKPGSAEEAGPLFDFDVPLSLESVPSVQQINVPEPIMVMAFQPYTCEKSSYSRMIVATAPMPARSRVTVSMLHRYAEKLANGKWGPRFLPYPGVASQTSRWSVDHSHYRGYQLDVGIKSATTDLCGAKSGVVKILALDHGDSHLLFAVAADLAGNPAHAPIPSQQDVDLLFESARPLR